MWRSVVLAGLALLMACGHSSLTYEPVGAKEAQHEQWVTRAKLVAVDDFDVLVLAGGEVIGTIKMRYDPKARRRTLDRKAAEEAAGVGGTHIIRLSDGSKTSASYELKDDTVERARKPVPYPLYAVIRVPPKQWEGLPPVLQPYSASVQR